MSSAETSHAPARRPLRLWPGVVAVVLQWVGLLLVPRVAPDAGLYGLIGAAVCALAAVVWWLFFSRAPWLERVGALLLMPAAVLATRLFVDPTIAQAGMGNMMIFFSIPLLSLALVAWAAATRRLSAGARWAALPVALLLGCLPFALVRSGGVSGEGHSDFHWRWTPTPEERLLAQGAEPLASPPAPKPAEPTPTPASESATPQPSPQAAAPGRKQADAAAAPGQPATSSPSASAGPAPSTSSSASGPEADWPGFRGPGRDGVVHGVRIATDWSASPPVQLWRRAIGPAWSSFAVRGELVYTQEQRGEEEMVTCYRLDTGAPVWRHGDPIRHWDSEGGPGPRATPTVHDGRVYSFGGTGRLNALDARSGALVWSRDAAAEVGVENPGWGFAGSPLVVGDVVIVAVSGRLAAYDVRNGERRWLGPEGGAGYSSPHLATIDGVPQVLLLRGSRSTSVAPADGALLWEHKAAQPGVSIVQPAMTADGDVLVAGGGTMGGSGIRRLAIAHGLSGWSVAERWMSTGLKPYFNDFVVHEGHAYGFDKNILAAIDLADGQRKWKGGRYGAGQLILLPEQDLLLVLSEHGELVLVRATPEAFTEVAKVPAIEGKSWSHPVLVGDRLLVRNAQEMAAFRLARAAASLAGGPFEASGLVVTPDGKGLLFVDDALPDVVLWMDLAADGSPKAAPVRVPLGVSVVDPEGLTTDGRYVYLVGSQSRGKARGEGPGLARFHFDAARGAAQGAETIDGLGALLAAAVPEVRPTGGKKKAPLNIEGMAWDAKRGRLLLGLRAPLDRGQAMLIPVKLRDASGPFAAANLVVEEPIRLDLGGAGVRSIEADADGDFWIIAGGSSGNRGASRIVRWDGSGSAVRPAATLPGNLKAEGVVRMVVGGKPATVVFCDTSQYLLLP